MTLGNYIVRSFHTLSYRSNRKSKATIKNTPLMSKLYLFKKLKEKINKGKLNPSGVSRLLDIVADVSFLHAQGYSDIGSIILNMTFHVNGPNLEQAFDLATPNFFPQRARLLLLQYLTEVCTLQHNPVRPYIQG